MVVENTIEQAKVAKILSLIDFNIKYMLAIKNINMDSIRDLKLTDMKKYWRCAGQIKEKVNRLYRDWIQALVLFMKHSQKMQDNKKVIKKIKIRREIDPK